jgi:hypothetical protein
MRPVLKRAVLLLVAVGAPALGQAAPPPGPKAAQPAIDPQADQELRRMTNYLPMVDSFKMTATAVDEMVTTTGEKLQSVTKSQIAIKRPNRMRTDRVGPTADVTLRYDGRQFSVYGKRTGMYAIAPAPPTLDRAIDVARDRYRLDAPGADLLFSKPYEVLMDGVTSGMYVGLEPIDNMLCHHLAFRAKEVDWQIWIQDGPEPLPRRYVITSKTEPGSPQFAVDLDQWEPNAPLAEQLFEFTPPAGARRIDFVAPSRASR